MDAIDSHLATTRVPQPSATPPTHRPADAATPARPTPQQFYQRMVRRPDIREILARLAK